MNRREIKTVKLPYKDHSKMNNKKVLLAYAKHHSHETKKWKVTIFGCSCCIYYVAHAGSSPIL